MRMIHVLGGNGSGKSTAFGLLLKNDPVLFKSKGFTRLKSGIRMVGGYGLTEDGRSSGGAENVGDIDTIKSILLALQSKLPAGTPVIMEGQISVSKPIAGWMHENLKSISLVYLRCNPDVAHERVRRRQDKPADWESYAVKQSHRGRNPGALGVHLANRPKMAVRELLVDRPSKKTPGKILTMPKEKVSIWVVKQIYELGGLPIPEWLTKMELAAWGL